jgi:hypothetical protein
MTENIERKIIDLIAADRIEMPISSMSGKLKRQKKKLAGNVDFGEEGQYTGERVYARVENEDTFKARGMSDGIAKFTAEFPRYGAILKGMIEEQRAVRETTLYFGVNDRCRLTDDDYMGVMKDLGFGDVTARNLYRELVQVSRNLARKRDEERGILIG